jgi:hypothetical protein
VTPFVYEGSGWWRDDLSPAGDACPPETMRKKHIIAILSYGADQLENKAWKTLDNSLAPTVTTPFSTIALMKQQGFSPSNGDRLTLMTFNGTDCGEGSTAKKIKGGKSWFKNELEQHTGTGNYDDKPILNPVRDDSRKKMWDSYDTLRDEVEKCIGNNDEVFLDVTYGQKTHTLVLFQALMRTLFHRPELEGHMHIYYGSILRDGDIESASIKDLSPFVLRAAIDLANRLGVEEEDFEEEPDEY